MEGIKRKILIVFLIVIALVLGYQACVIGINEQYTKDYGEGLNPPFQFKGTEIWAFCREHMNHYGFHPYFDPSERDYKCIAEIKTNDIKAYGFAYLLNKSNELNKEDRAQLQEWIYQHSGWSQGDTILNPNTDFASLFGGYTGNKEITGTENTNRPSLEDLLNDPTFNVVDMAPYKFFDEKNKNLINDITFNEYNYIYQLQSLCSYITAALYNVDINNDTEVNNLIQKIRTEEISKDKEADLSGTGKYDKRLFFNENKQNKQNEILKKYIKYCKNNDINGLEDYIQYQGYVQLANKIEDNRRNMLTASLFSTYDNINKKIQEIAKTSEPVNLNENGTVTFENNQDNLYFKFDGNVYQAAKIYQWLMTDDRLKNTADGFKVNTDGAKVSIDAKKGKYIVGPFSMNYATVILNDEVLLGLKSFNVKLNETNLDESKYRIIKSGNGNIPASGEVFYIELNKDVKEDGTILDKNDKITFSATYDYVKSISATVHFFHAIDEKNNVENIGGEATYDVGHPQRLMTFSDKNEERDVIKKEGSVSPDYWDFVIEKYEKGTENRLKGAEFAALACYKIKSGPDKGKDIYVDLEKIYSGGQSIHYGEVINNGTSKTFTALNSVKGKYKTDDEGKITFANVPYLIKYGENEGTIYSIVAKETKAPDGYKIDDTHFEIIRKTRITTERRDNEKDSGPYEIKVRKVDEKGKPISGLTFEYYYFKLNEDIVTASEGEFNYDHSKKATTDANGYATFEAKAQGDLIALVASEVPDDKAKGYQYFNSILILYSTKVDSNGNQLEFFDSEGSSDAAKDLYKENSFGIGCSKNYKITNGVYRITTKEGKELFGKDAEKYIKTGKQVGNNIDIQITNERTKPYSLELYKYDENGKPSNYLDGTEFKVTIAKDNKNVYEDTIKITNGKATIEDLDIYGENLTVYLQEKPNQGFKTVLQSNDQPVLIYNADEFGKIEIKEVSENLLNPTQSEISGDKLATVDDKTISLKLGIINQSEEYTLKFRKVDENEKPLQGATFGLYKGETCIGTDTTDENGYMTFKGLTLTSKDENDVITLKLKEISSKGGYEFSNSDVQLEYVYIPGSNVLKHVKITKLSDNSVLREQDELQIEENENKEIIFNLRKLNEIFEIVNTPNPYDLEAFTKVDENGKPIADIDFNVSIYSIKEDETKNFVDSKDGKVENRKVTSNTEGKVIIEGIKDYGTYYVEVKETSKSDKYETLTDTLRFQYTINTGDTKVKWEDTLEILDKNGNVVETFTKTGVSTAFQKDNENYENVKIDNDDLYLINKNKPYNLVLNKVNGLTGEPMPGVEFSATVLKNHTSEKQYFTGTTDEEGKIVLKGIKIYSTPKEDVEKDRERLTVIIDEKVPEGYKWHGEYEEIRYIVDYKKFSATDPIERYEGLSGTIAGKKETMYELIDNNANIAITESSEGAQSEIITIKNMPVYDLPIFDKKVERVGETETEIKGGIKFTAKLVNGSGELLQENVKVTFDENGIIARDIDTCKEFMNADGTIKSKVEGLKLILTEVESNKYEKIDDITVVYNCTYNKATDKFETQITDFEYQGTSYNYQNKKDLIDGLIYVVDGKAVLVNPPKSTELALRKLDENGNPVAGVKFKGKVYKADNENQYESFDVTTGDVTTGEGLAVIRNITLTGEVKVVIEEEKWANEDIKFGYNELEFMKNIEISGIVINVDEKGNRTVDYTNAKVDDTHKKQVKINKTTMEIEVTNKFLTYNIPIVKTTDLLSIDKNADRLPNVMFNVIIKNDGAEQATAQVFNNVETNSKGELVIPGIKKFGNVILTLEETIGAPNTKMLEQPVNIEYKATIENGEVKLKFEDKTYGDGKIAYITDLEVLNVVNPKDYSITLHKKMNVNGTPQEMNDGNEVTFKGIVTTNKDIVVNINGKDKKVSELTYDEFAKNINNIKALDSENVKYFDGATTKGLYEVPGLNFYKQTVYVYFIETNVPNSMTTIDEVIKVSFIQEDASAKAKDTSSDKVSLNTENKLNIELTVENPASSYKVNLIKVDEITKEKVPLKNAKFKVVLKELNGESTVSRGEAIISLGSTGDIDEKNSQLREHIVGMKLLEDGYIQLDVNKFGKLQLEITEEKAPKHYIKYEHTIVVPYVAEPGKISENKVIGAANGYVTSAVETDTLSLDITIQNPPQPYDLTINKVVKQDLSSSDSTAGDNIKFDVNFFNTKGERIMPDKTTIYNVQNGKFTVKDIAEFGEYYITLKEYDVPDDVVKLEGIHVFKIKATPKDSESNGMVVSEDVVKEITYEGTAKIENDKLTINHNDKSQYEKYFDTYDENGGIARLEITNIATKKYYLDLTKIGVDKDGKTLTDDEGKPRTLSGAKFNLYLTESDENYLEGNNLLGKADGIETGPGGKIAIGPLDKMGEYKLTIIEVEPPQKMKKTFKMIEVIYSTKDGKNLEVKSIKVDGTEVKDKNTTAVEYGEGTNEGYASIELTIKNVEKKPVPLSIKKIYYKGEEKEEVPVKNAVFSGVVREVETGYEYPFTDRITNENGEANLGSFYIDGEVEVEITEVIAPAEVGTIPKTTIYITVNNEKQEVVGDNYKCSTNALEGITGNTFRLVDPEEITPTITLAGLVWEDVKTYSKGEDSYTSEDGSYREGLYDAGKDKTVAGVVVNLYKKGSDKAVDTKTTGADGTYVFDNLDPFSKYYITFEYNGIDYEEVKYLVKDVNSQVSYGSIKDAIDKPNWDVNSKAVTNSDKKNSNSAIATTTETSKAIGEEGSNIQYYPVYDQFTIDYKVDDKVDDKGITLYLKEAQQGNDGKYNGNYTIKKDDKGNVIRDDKGRIIYIEKTNGEYIITTDKTGYEIEFKPLQPSHAHINFGIKESPIFDLRLSKDVEDITVELNNGTPMQYKYGIKPDSAMYKLEISKADIQIINKMEIVYKITVNNENKSDGTLKSIADYYDSDILTYSGWSKTKDGVYTKDGNEKDIEDTANLIPKQTYKASESKRSKDDEGNTKRAIINTNQTITSTEPVVIYVKYEYNNNLLDDLRSANIRDRFVTLGVAEIFASESTKGRQDKDSIAGNLASKYNDISYTQYPYKSFYEDNGESSFYTKLNNSEDDEDAAPATEIVVGTNNRSISGNVFEDLDGQGILTDDDTLIKGVTVSLCDVQSTKIIANTSTDENGYYKFTEIPAGKYVVIFTYGDINTVLPILKESEDKSVTDDKPVKIGEYTYPRQNDKSYNALEFEATAYNANDYLEKDENGNMIHNDYWYAKPEVAEKSNAYDIEGNDTITQETRKFADALLNKSDELENVMNNKKAELLYSYKGDTNKREVQEYIKTLAEHHVMAQTSVFKVNMENTASDKVQYESEAENGTVYYEGGIIANTSLANNIDFGIKERPQSDITVTKQVENVKIYTSAGNVNVDVSLDENGKTVGTASRVQWNKGANSGKGYIWIQRAEEEIVGATLEITYKITVTNGAGEDITVRVADYVQDGMTYTEAKNKDAGWKIAKAQSEIKGETITSSKVGDVEINNTIDLRSVSTVVVNDVTVQANKKSDVNITLTKTLNAYSDTDIDAYTNYVEVIQTTSEGLARKDINSIPGNYDPIQQKTTEGHLGKIVTSLDVNGLEKDSSKALETISITAETGENRATYYILTFAVIAVFATGVVLIKKYAIKK